MSELTHSGKVALITGITGQDGSYLTEFLLSKGYTVRSNNMSLVWRLEVKCWMVSLAQAGSTEVHEFCCSQVYEVLLSSG